MDVHSRRFKIWMNPDPTKKLLLCDAAFWVVVCLLAFFSLLTSYWVILIRNLRFVSYIWMDGKHFSDTSEYYVEMCKILSLYTSSYWQWFKLTESWYGIIPFWKILNGKLDTCVPAVRKHKLLNMLHQEKINCSELSTSESVQCFLHHGHALIIPSSIISTKLKLIICRQPPDLYWSTQGDSVPN